MITLYARKNPNAIFPTELFQHLVRFHFAHPPHSSDTNPLRNSDLFGSDENWRTLEKITAEYAQLIRESDAGDSSKRSALSPKVHVAEIKALRAARSAFGRLRFDAFLYQVVGEGFFVSYPKPPSEEHLQKLLQRDEEAE